MEQTTLAIILSIIGSLGGVGSFISVLIINRNKPQLEEAGAAAKLVETAMKIVAETVEPMQESIASLEEKNSDLEARYDDMNKKHEEERKMFLDIIANLLQGVRILSKQVECSGEDPEFTIPEDIADILKKYNIE